MLHNDPVFKPEIRARAVDQDIPSDLLGEAGKIELLFDAIESELPIWP